MNDPEMRSEKDVDYRPLRNLLQQGAWNQADQTTAGILAQLIEQKKVHLHSHEGYYDPDDDYDVYRIERKPIPCLDLLTMDRLWVTYSKGRFGFSVQVKIYLECLKPGASHGSQPFDLLIERVGWARERYRGSNYIYPKFRHLKDFPVENLPDGYFPSATLYLYASGWDEYSDDFTQFVSERWFQCCRAHSE